MSAKSHDDQMKDISSNPHPDDVDALMASELHGMTLQEREIVYEEVHGVDKETVETPLLLAESLERMKVALEQQVPKLRQCYNQARQINPDYVDSPALWLQFLRAEYFDAPNAALRLCRFLAGKVEFFGLDSLARPISLDEDFDDDDIAWLKTGIIQILPSRDRSGRAVLADFNMQSDFPQPKKIESLIKTVVYMACCIAEDVDNQKRGVVGLFYFPSATQTAKRLLQRDSRMFDWLPLRIAGGHLCYNNPNLRFLNALLMLVIGRDRRVRLRLHEGSHTECQYKLMTFGIPVKSFPVTYEGDLKTATHLQWLARRKVKETAMRTTGVPFEGVDLPGARDVLFGRGKTNQEHSGNVVMRNIIAEYIPAYRVATKPEKGRIPLQVVQRIKGEGGRFLKRDTDHGWWLQVSDETARQKISMSFRTTSSSGGSRTVSPPVVSAPKSNDVATERDTKRPRQG